MGIFACYHLSSRQLLLRGCAYLQDSATVIDGLRLYGSPYTPRFFDRAF